MQVSQHVYVTGTDTSAGKTRFAAALVAALREQGRKVGVMKPVASGCQISERGLRNDDALALMAASGREFDYMDVNPEALLEPVSPHIAAAWRGREISIDAIADAYQRLKGAAECMVVEGVGGWAAPLGADLDQAQLCRRLGLPALLVVGLRLGCLNHATLSYRAIRADGIAWAGWGVSVLDPEMHAREENLAWLKQRLPGPFIGELAFGAERLSHFPGQAGTG